VAATGLADEAAVADGLLVVAFFSAGSVVKHYSPSSTLR